MYKVVEFVYTKYNEDQFFTKGNYYYLRNTKRGNSFVLTTDLITIELEILGSKLSISTDTKQRELLSNFSLTRVLYFKNYREFRDWLKKKGGK